MRRVYRKTIGPATARDLIAARLQRREASFLDILARGVYANPRSPYRRLLDHAGFGFDDVRALVADCGLEGALGRLYEAGVYVTAEEVKGRRPVRRGDLEFEVAETDFDNPLADAAFEGQTSGSTGAPARVFIGFDLMEHDAAYYACLFAAHNVEDRPLAFWHATLHTALKNVFKHAQCRGAPERWFTTGRFVWGNEVLRHRYTLALTLLLSRVFGRPSPWPRYVPRGEALEVARWLGEQTRQGRPALLETNHSPAVRVCLAARENGLDISGTVFHLTGEPYTPAKAAVIAAAGAQAIDRYANVEVGVMAVACAAPCGFDDLHFASDKLALIQRETPLGDTGETVDALVYTSLVASTPKLWLNVRNGDYATVASRDCGCPFGALGLTTHLSGVRAYDKLTSEGVTLLGSGLYRLLEEVLPARFGGAPTDYQLVEEEVDGLPRVSLVVRPGVGPVDEAALIAAVYESMEAYSRGGPVMADEWRQGGTVRVVRRDPYETSSAKILPLHVVQRARTRVS